MKAIINGCVPALIFWVALFASVAACGQTFVWESSMEIPMLHGGDTISNKGNSDALFMVETKPGFKYTIIMDELPTSLIFKASQYTSAYGVTVQGDVVGNVSKGDWINYRFYVPSQKTTLLYTYAMDDDINGAVEVRIGGIDKEPAVKAVLKPTGGWNKFVTIAIELSLPVGNIDLYFTFKESPRPEGAGGNIKAMTYR